MSAVTVSYGSFSFGQVDALPLPFISVDYDYVKAGEKWATVTRLTLSGEIVGCSKAEFLSYQNEITEAFSEDFKALVVTGLDTPTDLCVVESINFSPSDYVTTMSYSIEIHITDALYDVLSPVDSVQIDENEDQTITIRHTVSARGVRTNAASNNALANAQTFVQDRVNSSQDAVSRPQSNLIDSSKNPNFKRILISEEETVDRIRGEYGVTRVYTSDPTAAAEGGEVILRYTRTVEQNKGQSPEKSTTIQGRIEGGMNGDFSQVRDALLKFKDSLNTSLVNTLIESMSVTEDECENSLNFSLTYGDGDDGGLEIIDDQCVSIAENSSSESVTITVSGTISAKGPRGTVGSNDCRWGKVKAYFKPDKYKDKAQELYNQTKKDGDLEDSTCESEDEKINEVANSSSVTENPYDATISYSYSYSTASKEKSTNGKYEVDSTVTVRTTLGAIGVNPLIGGGFAFVDLGFNHRGSVTVQGSAKSIQQPDSNDNCDEIDEDAPSELSQVAEDMAKKVLPTLDKNGLLEASTFGVTSDGDTSFSYTWSFGGKAATDAENGDFINPIRLSPQIEN